MFLGIYLWTASLLLGVSHDKLNLYWIKRIIAFSKKPTGVIREGSPFPDVNAQKSHS
jgi:hypothetical protein